MFAFNKKIKRFPAKLTEKLLFFSDDAKFNYPDLTSNANF